MKPVVVQHSFGEPGSGGPIGALERLMASSLASDYTMLRMHQDVATGGINTSLIRTWVRMLRRTRPDLVHVRGLGNEGFHGALAARLAGCPNILVSIHGTVRDLTHSDRRVRRAILARVLEPITLWLATDIVAVCDAMEKRDFLGPAQSRMRKVVPNGVELPRAISIEARTSLRAELGLEPHHIGLACVGRLSFEKGHLDLARALASCSKGVLNRVVLVLVGDGPDSDAILAAYSGVPGLEVRALGRRDDVTGLLPACDVFVFPTLHENLSNALLEAMAAGLPVVATAVGGNVEVLAKGGGVLVEASDHQALAGAISLLVADDARRRHLGAQAREVVASAYTMDHMIAGWDDCYRAVLSSGRTR